MHDAAKRGNCDFMKECLANKVSVNGLDKAGNTSLHWVHILYLVFFHDKHKLNDLYLI